MLTTFGILHYFCLFLSFSPLFSFSHDVDIDQNGNIPASLHNMKAWLCISSVEAEARGSDNVKNLHRKEDESSRDFLLLTLMSGFVHS